MIEKSQLKKILEGALLAYAQPLSLDKLHALFVTETTETEEGDQLPAAAQVEKEDIVDALEEIQNSCDERGFELKKVASGWRFQVREETAPWVNKLWEEKPQRYSRALMETIAIIAYRQPITRGDIEEVRGVAVSSNIIKTLTEREWVKVIGHRDVPGRPALFATTKQFLDYFNLQSLEELPSLRELTDIENLTPELNLQTVDVPPTEDEEDFDVDDTPVSISDAANNDTTDDETATIDSQDQDQNLHTADADKEDADSQQADASDTPTHTDSDEQVVH
jgi:segregation and condensation protein B